MFKGKLKWSWCFLLWKKPGCILLIWLRTWGVRMSPPTNQLNEKEKKKTFKKQFNKKTTFNTVCSQHKTRNEKSNWLAIVEILPMDVETKPLVIKESNIVGFNLRCFKYNTDNKFLEVKKPISLEQKVLNCWEKWCNSNKNWEQLKWRLPLFLQGTLVL